MDSAALSLELERWGPATGLTVARISADSTGAPSAMIASEALDAAGRDRLEEILERHTRVTPDRREPMSLEVGTWMGLAPRRLERTQQCSPQVLNMAEIQRGLMQEAVRLDVEGQARVIVCMFVETDGTVGQARVYESSGRLNVDRATLDVMRGTIFSPARLEGIPLGAWVQIPVNVQVIEQPREPPLMPPPRF